MRSPITSCIHLLFSIIWQTMRLLIVCVSTAAWIRGAISLAANPWIHQSHQNSTLVPSPTSILTKLSKSNRASLSSTIVSPCHGLSGSVLLSHSHLSRRASACIFKFLSPSPPSLVGLQTVLRATKQLPPFIFSLPDQKKARVH